MALKYYVLAAAVSLSVSPLAFAQNNPTTLGTEGPNSNSAGYPSGQTPAGRLTTTQIGPSGTTQAAPTVRHHHHRRKYRTPNPS